MTDIIPATFVILAVVVGCAPRKAPDVMRARPVCDSIPPQVQLAPLVTGRIPHVSAGRDVGAVVGIVTESGGGGPLPYGDASLLRTPGNVVVAGPVRVDSLGGFALTDVPPDGYILRVRALNHEPEARRLTVKAGAVDTIRLALRYYVCHGY